MVCLIYDQHKQLTRIFVSGGAYRQPLMNLFKDQSDGNGLFICQSDNWNR